MKISPLILLSAIACLAFSSNAYSTPITVTNYSFEAPVGGGSSGVVQGWTVTPGGNLGIYAPTSGQYPMVSGFLPSPGEGHQVAYINTVSGFISQTITGTSLVGNNVYTLTVAIGNRKDLATMANFTINLLAGATVLATTSGNSETFAPDGGFADATLTYTSPGTGFPTGDLQIQLIGSGIQVNFDNVRLDATAVPEPSSVALICIGGIGFLSWKARRRMRLNR